MRARARLRPFALGLDAEYTINVKYIPLVLPSVPSLLLSLVRTSSPIELRSNLVQSEMEPMVSPWTWTAMSHT